MSQWVDTLFLDFISVNITDEVLYETSELTFGSTLQQQISSLLPDGLDLSVIGIGSLGELFLLLKSESIDEYSHDEPILSLDIYEDVDE